jgi:PAS domain S-box-containing protein
MEQKSPPQPEHRRMSKGELLHRLHGLQSPSLDKSLGKDRETELQAVLHELETYQIELEMQNRELVESREALEESHDRFVSLYDFAPIGYVTFDEQGVMKELNLTLASMLGVERGWLLERSLSPWVVSSDLPIFRKHMKLCNSGEERVESILRLVRKDKQILAVELKSICSIYKATGVRVIRTGIVDVTEKKKLENELLNSLKGLKEERTLRELFVSTLTHDLRTPMTIAKMGAQLLLRNPQIIDESRVVTERILDNTMRMDIMIHNLLDANRIRAGEKIPVKREDSDLVELTQKTLESLKEIHGNRFKLIAPTVCWCSLDSMGIRRVIENLCSNAVKYGEKKTPITVTISRSGNEVQLSIHNEGPVISRKDQLTLFNQFQRSESATSSGKKGWGIGLTLIRGLVESHGGRVQLVSEIGLGTTFTVELPTSGG